MPQFIYRLRVTQPDMLTDAPTQEEAQIVRAHFERLQQLMAQGVVILAGRTLNTDPDSFGIVIFNAANETAARALMESDPAVAGGVMDAQLFPYRVALIAEQNIIH